MTCLNERYTIAEWNSLIPELLEMFKAGTAIEGKPKGFLMFGQVGRSIITFKESGRSYDCIAWGYGMDRVDCKDITDPAVLVREEVSGGEGI